MKGLLCLSFCLMGLWTVISAQNVQTRNDEEVVIAWLRNNSVPIKYINAGNGFSDLKPLEKRLQDVRVIGLGEATHGTSEFFKMKHRLVEFLVTQMNFTAFAIESNYSACQPINDYILYGKGDKATILTGQGYLVWDNEEFMTLLDWMRMYNQKVPDDKKIRFYGVDLGVNDLGREQVLLYVKKYVPDQLASVDSAFQLLKTEEANWPTRINQDKLQQAFILLQKFINYIATNQSKLVSSSSNVEWENIAQYVHVMKQWLLANMKDIPPSHSGKKLKRQEYMAQNAIYLIDKVKPNAKFIFWAYNGHLSKSDTTWRNIGYYLNERLGEKYYALGLECYQGTFQSRVLQPDNFWGELKPDTIAPIEKSITWYFAQTRKGNLFVDYRMAQSDPTVNKWLETSQIIGMGYWINRGSKANQDSLKLKGNFDGTLFIERSTPSHPTKNAIERSLKKVGL